MHHVLKYVSGFSDIWQSIKSDIVTWHPYPARPVPAMNDYHNFTPDFVTSLTFSNIWYLILSSMAKCLQLAHTRLTMSCIHLVTIINTLKKVATTIIHRRKFHKLHLLSKNGVRREGRIITLIKHNQPELCAWGRSVSGRSSQRSQQLQSAQYPHETFSLHSKISENLYCARVIPTCPPKYTSHSRFTRVTPMCHTQAKHLWNTSWNNKSDISYLKPAKPLISTFWSTQDLSW